MSLSESCRKIIVHDCLGLRKKTITLLQSGYSIKGTFSNFFESSIWVFYSIDTDLCAKCHNPVYTSSKFWPLCEWKTSQIDFCIGTLTNLPVSVFFCLHVFHAKCIETNPVRGKRFSWILIYKNCTFRMFVVYVRLLLCSVQRNSNRQPSESSISSFFFFFSPS